ncbi:MAG: GSCFA domain-containing protein [Bacteroidales bacterium]|nr:GSCFA domain-containing protein [Bacteroidales bacterium]
MEELKLQTPVEAGKSKVGISLEDNIMVLGSCFADNIGQKMVEAGFDACVNPFGTLYNPVSVCNSVARLASGVPFSEKDCVEMGAGAGLVCSFSHHTSFARPTEGEFLANANESLENASSFWKKASKVVITLGTAWCFEHLGTGEIVANCLKRNSQEFLRKRLSVKEVSILLKNMVSRFREKEFIFTVSPIRHFKDGAHGNQLSKGVLLLGLEETFASFPERTDYFPAYEIVLDELRDYRFYATDMVHPSAQAVDYLWSRFVDWAVPPADFPTLEENRRQLIAARHRPLHPAR